MSKHKAIDIIQGQIDAREVSCRSYKDSAEYHVREAGENLVKADRAQADINALREAIAALSTAEYASANKLSDIASKVRDVTREKGVPMR